MMTPIAYSDSLRIGNVDFVSPDEIKVLLDVEAPNDVALNSGLPRPFPRINSYVLLPNESGFLVAQIEWITIERSQYPKRKGMQDFGVVDLPFPLRKMSLAPLGVLSEKKDGDKSIFEFARGVQAFPTVGDSVLLPTQVQLKSIVESGEKRRVKIGTSPLAGNAEVSIDPDRLFGRHLAILGNTGSGKSCSVAGVIRWSMDAAREKCDETIVEPHGLKLSDDERKKYYPINSRFIILDPNGEYLEAFSDMENVRVYAVEENTAKGIRQLQVPLWFWNSAEWAAFTQARSGAQRPTLIQALRTVRDGTINLESATPSHEMRRFLRTVVSIIAVERSTGNPWGNFPKNLSFFEKIQKWQDEINPNDNFTEDENAALGVLKTKVDALVAARTKKNPKDYPNYDFTRSEINELFRLASIAHSTFGGSDQDVLPIDADVPRPFTGEGLLRSIEANSELMGTSEFVETMLMRIRTLLSDSRLKLITTCDENLTLNKWLDDYVCPSDSSSGAITVIDLSLVPAEVIQIVTAVIARMTLEALQRYRRRSNGSTLPTTIVMEEAHTFIRRYTPESEDSAANVMCTQVFEKIAREGRKYGLGLVLSSQRPSELSQTVLSQCNTFLLHRISNDRDQELVNKLVPDNLRGLLRELPSLPSRRAILLGWASELPVMVQMNYLPKKQQPLSADPDYWDTWINDAKAKKSVNWEAIAQEWQESVQITKTDERVEEELGVAPIEDDDELPF